jgi:malonyl-CoA O-methyltransferase
MGTLERDNRIKNIRTRFSRALRTYDSAAVAQHRISERLLRLLKEESSRRRFDNVLEIGCGTGGFTRLLTKECQISHLTLNDLCNECEPIVSRAVEGVPHSFIFGDAESVPFEGGYDLIASSSAFQWMANPESFFSKLSSLLNKDGLLLFSTFSPDNFYEVREITGCGLNYPDVEKIKSYLRNNFSITSVIVEEIGLWFDSPIAVLAHMKKTGVTATGKLAWTRGEQKAFCDRYEQSYSNCERNVKLTYKPIYVLAQKKT